tara:strand:+ start:33330 stop:33509 length:180 start_codon:yes stop_codon:yes gene_type:complete
MFYGMDIVAVDDGAEIECDGEKLIVSALRAVAKGRTFYVTHAHFAALKANASISPKEDE